MTNSRDLLSSVVFGMVVVLACVSISLQNVAAQCSSLLRDANLDMAEAAEAGNVTMANQTTGGNTTDVQFLAIQGSISQINETAYTLELNNVSDSTILFSDRPERRVTTTSTADFIGNWAIGPDSFAADAPNAALIVENAQSNLETALVELFDPVYDANTNTLTYTIIAENATSVDLPGEFGQNILVIYSNNNIIKLNKVIK